MANVRGMAVLARWLGPWASESASPPARRREIRIPASSPGETELTAVLYDPPGTLRGAYIIAPGVHYDGPDDPRSDRFCRILAAAGALVMAPRIPSYMQLRVDERAIADFSRAYAALRARPELPASIRPRVFSISFGSLLALHLAATPEHARSLGGLILFGGYGDWDAIMDYCLTGKVAGVPVPGSDPLNQPIVFTNLLAHMKDAPGPEDAETLHAAWHRFCTRTWGRPEMKNPTAYAPIAHEIARELPGPLRRWFLIGCGLEPGNYEMCFDGLARGGEKGFYLYPMRILSRIRCPVTLLHGVDDDVVPYSQSELLAEALRGQVPVALYLTGLYGHSSQARSNERGGRSLPALAREIAGMVGILRALTPDNP